MNCKHRTSQPDTLDFAGKDPNLCSVLVSWHLTSVRTCSIRPSHSPCLCGLFTLPRWSSSPSLSGDFLLIFSSNVDTIIKFFLPLHAELVTPSFLSTYICPLEHRLILITYLPVSPSSGVEIRAYTLVHPQVLCLQLWRLLNV